MFYLENSDNYVSDKVPFSPVYFLFGDMVHILSILDAIDCCSWLQLGRGKI